LRKVDVVAGVLYSEGRFLVTQRREGKEGAWKWEFPGGKVENETKEQALIRELSEELGIRVEVIELICTTKHISESKSESNLEIKEWVKEGRTEYQIHYFYSRIIEGEPRAIECKKVKWVSYAILEKLELLDADRKSLPRIYEYFSRKRLLKCDDKCDNYR